MKRTAVIFLFSIYTLTLSAQAGLTLSYQQLDAPNWTSLMNESTIYQFDNEGNFSPALHYGIDYWFRLPEVRIEFLPTLSYSKFSEQPVSLLPDLAAPQSLDLSIAALTMHTNIYFLDFLGDCDCPTFSKQDPLFKKGLFVQVSPGAVSTIQSLGDITTLNNERTTNSDIAFSMGLGLGLDIGFSDLLTLTPFVRAKRHFNVNWNDFEYQMTGQKPENSPNNTNHLTQFEAGIRLGIRWRT